MEGTISEIRYFGPNWAPRSWFPCDGRLLAISQFTAFFSLIGTIYGGDGRTTFAVPDLRGRVAVGSGHGPGLSMRVNGQMGGAETVTLNILETPTHNHSANTTLGSASAQIASTGPGSTGTPTAGSHPGSATDVNGDAINLYTNSGSPIVSPVSGNATTTIGLTGGSQSHQNMQPWECITPIICYQGIFPSRN
ncbi:tail fiber protein [Fulvivirga kasyanovii]|uniref:Phage tail protein n=1 Tax=Fulvivirga kasyanovii TaxID=396812 RepID=A0ABW9RTK7_9BACT|nr:tail fiber protein [Fulvivirga kasyanovii]MTI27027.1 phage tail protein [Fulvivirga kasyanovii]